MSGAMSVGVSAAAAAAGLKLRAVRAEWLAFDPGGTNCR
jgi:hypothetical protein